MTGCINCLIERSDWEELANTVTHLIGFVGVTVGLLLFSIKICRHPRRWRYWGPCLVFTATLGTMYMASATYHAATGPWKSDALVLDHIGVLLALGGTASAYALLCKPHYGWRHYALIWLGVLGALVIAVARRGDATLVAMMASGLSLAFIIHMSRKPNPGFGWILAGVAAYVIGLPFLLVIQIPFAHACWHIFVMIGTVLHYIALRKATAKPDRIEHAVVELGIGSRSCDVPS